MVFYCDFNLYFPHDKGCSTFFHVIFGHLNVISLNDRSSPQGAYSLLINSNEQIEKEIAKCGKCFERKNLNACTENNGKCTLFTNGSQGSLRRCHCKADPSEGVSQVKCRGGNNTKWGINKPHCWRIIQQWKVTEPQLPATMWVNLRSI